MTLDNLVDELEIFFEEKERVHLDHFEQVDDDRYNLRFAIDEREDLNFDIKQESDGYMIQTSIPFWFSGEMKRYQNESEWFMQTSTPFGSPDIATNLLKEGHELQREVSDLVNRYVSSSDSLQPKRKEYSYE